MRNPCDFHDIIHSYHLRCPVRSGQLGQRVRRGSVITHIRWTARGETDIEVRTIMCMYVSLSPLTLSLSLYTETLLHFVRVSFVEPS